MKYISYLEIANHLPINRGDVLFVSSDMVRLALEAHKHKEKLDVNKFIDTFIEKIGTEGTLIFPTYNWDFCKGEAFDYEKTSCKTGSLGTTALRRSDFQRTQHPIYSFAVWGKDKELLVNMDNRSSFGQDSPFAYLHHKKAKNLQIDVECNDCFTFVHYVQEMSDVRDCRYMKLFTAPYIDSEGKSTIQTYSMLVRDLDLDVQNDLVPIGMEMEKLGIAQKTVLNEIPFTVVDMDAAFDLVMQDVKENRSRKICKFIGQ